MENTYHFQVNLGGMLDVLSNHLYKARMCSFESCCKTVWTPSPCGRSHSRIGTEGKITITVEPGRPSDLSTTARVSARRASTAFWR